MSSREDEAFFSGFMVGMVIVFAVVIIAFIGIIPSLYRHINNDTEHYSKDFASWCRIEHGHVTTAGDKHLCLRGTNLLFKES